MQPRREIPVVVLLSTAEVGGHERMLFEWLVCARELGLRPTIYCRASRDVTDLAETLGLPWIETGYVAHRSGILHGARWRNFILTLKTVMRLPQGAPVLLAPGSMRVPVLQVLACVLGRRPIVCYVPMTYDSVTLRERWPALRDWLTARLAPWVRMWITISDEQARRLRGYWRVRAPVHIVPNCLRVLSTPPGSPKAEAAQHSPLQVVYVGRFSSNQKGLDWLTEVLAAEPAWLSDYRFTFQGAGHFLGQLDAMARQLGPARIRVLPWGDTAEALAAADVLMLTSRFEGLPLVAIEAIWAGVPVVATLESGLAEVLPEVCLFPFGDTARFQAALQCMRDHVRRHEAVAHARRKLQELLPQERYQASIRSVTENLAALGGIQ